MHYMSWFQSRFLRWGSSAEKKGTQLRVLSRTELFPVLIITML